RNRCAPGNAFATLARRRSHEHHHREGWHDDLLQGLGHRPGRHVLARLATELRRLGRPDVVPRAERVPRGRARPARPWPLESGLFRHDMDGYAADLAAVIEALDIREATVV